MNQYKQVERRIYFWWANYSPNGRFIATDGIDHGRIWDAASGKLLQQIESNDNWWFAGAAFNPNSTCLLFAGIASAKVFDVRSGRPFIDLRGNPAVQSLTFNRKGDSIIVGNGFGPINIYGCEECGVFDDLIELSKKRVFRKLTAEEGLRFLHSRE